MTAFELGMGEASDSMLLVWAADEGRVVVTHDRRTMPSHAAELMAQEKTIAGLFIAPRDLPLHQVIEDLELLVPAAKTTSG